MAKNLKSKGFLVALLAALNLSSFSSRNQTSPADQAKIIIGENHVLANQNPRQHHVECQLAVSPRNPNTWIISSMIIDDPLKWKIHCALWVSQNAGKTWRRTDFEDSFADPWVVINDHNQAYFSYLGKKVDAYHISPDGGQSWSNSIPVGGSHDHPFNFSSGSNVYWWSTTKGNRVLDLKIATDGDHFVDLKTFPIDNENNHDNFLGVALSTNELILPFSTYKSTRRSVTSKGDYILKVAPNGEILQKPTLITKMAGSRKGVKSLHADKSSSSYKDNLYFLYPLGQNEVFKGIGMSISSDKGKTWKDKIIQPPVPSNNKYYCPTAAVNNKGILGVYWYERRNDRSRNNNDIYFTASLDGGESFMTPVRVTEVSGSPEPSHSNGRVIKSFPGGGHYSGLSALKDGSFQLVWSDARSGYYQLYTTNVKVVQ